MSYGRATSSKELEPEVVQALARILEFDISDEEARALTTAVLNQFAAMQSMERFDLQEIVPILKMQGHWDE